MLGTKNWEADPAYVVAQLGNTVIANQPHTE